MLYVERVRTVEVQLSLVTVVLTVSGEVGSHPTSQTPSNGVSTPSTKPVSSLGTPEDLDVAISIAVPNLSN